MFGGSPLIEKRETVGSRCRAENWEEVNIVSRGGNYGWNRIEADSMFRAETEFATENDDSPVAIYGHQWGGSITGGYVYRGRSFRVWSVPISMGTT